MPTYLDSNHSHPHENKQIPFNEGQNFGLNAQINPKPDEDGVGGGSSQTFSYTIVLK
jgi:hypothetical protein